MIRKKKWPKILLVFCGVLLLLTAVVWAVWHFGMDPYRENLNELTESAELSKVLTKKEAKEDLNYFVKKLKGYHPAWLDGSEEIPAVVMKCMEEETKALDGVSREVITVKELWQASARVAAATKSGHVRVAWNNSQPLFISDISLIREYPLLAVDGISADVLYKTFLEQFSYELESYAESEFTQCVISQASLEFLNIDTSDGADFTFETPQGERTVHYAFVPAEKVQGQEDNTQEASGEPSSHVGFTLEPEHDAAVLTLTQCIGDQTYADTLKAFFEKIQEADIQNAIVDLRENGGGNSNVANRFISYLDTDRYYSTGGVDIRLGRYLKQIDAFPTENRKAEPVFDGNVYVLTSANTFSSAMLFAEMIGDNGLGLIVGESSGNMPESYGDILTFQMPNSGLAFTIPYKKFKRIDQEKKDLPLIPDAQVDSADALQKTYELIAQKK